MTRRWFWLQLALGWAPVWALLVALVLTAHEGTGVGAAALIALRLIGAAAVLAPLVYRLTQRLPWPHPMRPGFMAVHLLAAAVFAAAWVLINSVIESIHYRQFALVVGPGLGPFLVFGVWLYVMIAGVTYSTQAAERAARIEAAAARAQLAALRAQLNPHFLFNALHTVVQLIPREPGRAAQATEQLAALLRSTIEETRDTLSLQEEWTFVERYLSIERIRFGDRLQVRTELSPEALGASIPSFALQTLVENAVRHGATPRAEPTEIAIAGSVGGGRLTLIVRDTGAGSRPEAVTGGTGTGLARLRERLAALYDGRARLDVRTQPEGGCTATLVLPVSPDGDADR